MFAFILHACKYIFLDDVTAYNVVNLELHSSETGHAVHYGQKLLKAAHIGLLVEVGLTEVTAEYNLAVFANSSHD